MITRFIRRLVDASSRHAVLVLLLTLATIAGSALYARKLELRSDLLELLPRDSPGFKAFEHQLGRVGGGATLIVVVESPDRKANERFVDALGSWLEALARNNANLVSYVETGTKDVRAFYDANKWLYADVADLERADQTLDRQVAIRSGMVEDLDDDGPSPQVQPDPPRAPPPGAPPPPPPAHAPKKALGMDEFRERWKQKAAEHDDFPTGYFATPDGTMMGVRIVSSSNLGDASGDSLLGKVKRLVSDMNPASFHPDMQIGFAGDIPNAAAEKDSLLSEAAGATAIALVLILAGVVFFFRSFAALFIIALPAFVGVTAAYAFAAAVYGYVNTSGAFLGAIILGNGINYPIVLLARYREFVARGMPRDEARREAVVNAFRAELVGALVAAIAYGSLTVTRFRGFNQFGVIGFVGMLLVWASIVPLVPALVVIVEAVQARLPRWLRAGEMKVRPDGSQGFFTRWVANASERWPWVFVLLGLAVTVAAVSKVPAYLKDPWEYDFGRLGSRASKAVRGAGEWSNKADRVFGGKMNIAGALMLADTPEQVPLLKRQILANDGRDPQGRLIADIAIIDDLLPGTPDEQEKKLAVLASIRERLTQRVLHELDPDERARVNEMRPPDKLHVVRREDLPPLLRRRFTENDGRVGTVFYVKIKNEVSLSDGHNQLRIARASDNVVLPDGTLVQTATRSTIFAEMIRSMERDGPLASAVSFGAVVIVVVLATSSLRGALAVLTALLMGVAWTLGGAAHWQLRLNYVNFIALPITFGIGSEYGFNIFDRSRLLGGDVTAAVKRSAGAVILCSYTTTVGYASLLYSDFQALESFGRLAVSGEVACIFAALFFMPAMLHLLGRPRAA